MPKKKGKAKEAQGYCLKQSTRTTKPVLGALYDNYFERPNETMKDSLCKMWSTPGQEQGSNSAIHAVISDEDFFHVQHTSHSLCPLQLKCFSSALS